MVRNILFALLLLAAPAHGAESNWATTERSSVRLVTSADAVTPGKTFYVALEKKLQPGWHTYTDPPGEAGLPTTLEMTMPKGFTASKILWPKHETFKEDILTTYGYHGHFYLPMEITAPESITEKKVTLKAHATWLICKDICIPEQADFTVELPVAADAKLTAHAAGIMAALETSTAPEGEMHFITAIIFALLGGIILNLMPCVFPVISLKALALVKKGSSVRAGVEGLAYTAGVLLCFSALAIALLALRGGGEAIGWGYQMQRPEFVAALGLILFIIGLNLSGLFELPVVAGSTGITFTRKGGLRGSFLTGLLAALVATPCTGPFMAAALGFAITQPAWIAFLVFLSLGLGFALPFLLLGFFPHLLQLLPKPGAWMERFRQLLAFPMYAAAAWLAWVLAQQTGAYGIGIFLITAVTLAFLLWLLRSRAVLALALCAVIGAYSIHLQRGMDKMDASVPYSPAALQSLLNEGKPVFLDATAAWCITCKFNETTTLSSKSVQDAFRARGITFMVADWTNKNPEITVLLERFGHSGVPLYVYFPPGKKPPVVLPQLLTPSTVLDVLEE